MKIEIEGDFQDYCSCCKFLSPVGGCCESGTNSNGNKTFIITNFEVNIKYFVKNFGKDFQEYRNNNTCEISKISVINKKCATITHID
jgi:hypothetical protein